MQINALGGSSYQILLGDPGEEFEFEGDLDMGFLTVTGSDTVNGTTLEILGASWGLAPDGNSFLGSMSVNRTEGGQTCLLGDDVNIYRVDTTNQSPVLGFWDWTIMPTISGGGCGPSVGDSSVAQVEILPRRAGEFLLDVYEGTMNFQLGGKLVGDTLELVSDYSYVGNSVVSPGSSLQMNGASTRLDGNLQFTFSSPSLNCGYGAEIYGKRASTGVSYLPFVEDANGAQRLMAVDPEDPQSTIDYQASLDNPALVPNTSMLGTWAYTGVSYRADFDPSTGTVTDRRPDRFFYIAGDTVWSVDLNQRVTASGELLPSEPEAIYSGALTTGAGQRLNVYSDLGPLEAILHFQTTSGPMVAEIAADGTVQTELVRGGVAKFDTFNPDTGHFQGVIIEDFSALKLYRVRVGVEQELGGPTYQVMQTANGGVLFGDKTMVWKYDPRNHLVSYLISPLATQQMSWGTVDGNDFYALFTYDTSPFWISLRRLPLDGGNEQLALHTNASDTALNTAGIVVSENYVAYQYKKVGSQTVMHAVPKDTSTGPFEITPLGNSFDLVTDVFTVMDDHMLLYSPNGARIRRIVPGTDGTDLGSGWAGVMYENDYILGERREPSTVLLRAWPFLEAYDHGIIDFSQTRTLMAELEEWVHVESYGEQLLVMTGSGDVLSTLQNKLLFGDWTESNSGVLVRDNPLERCIPLR